MLPCLIFEDDHLLVVNKPAGWNTHAPSPYAGEGIYDWLRNREPRWANLAIIQRLDKETSGLIVFAKTPAGNRSLTQQFTERTVRKKYLLLTDRPVRQNELVVKSCLVRAGDKYLSRPLRAGGESAETRFRLLGAADEPRFASTFDFRHWTLGYQVLEAHPLTGRTHQIRVHAAASGFPILGDTLYGGTPAPRVYLHAAELTFKHPASGEALTFRAEESRAGVPPALLQSKPWRGGGNGAEIGGARDGQAGRPPYVDLRAAMIEPEATNAYRVIHGASDGWPGWYVERFAVYLLSQSQSALTTAQRKELHLLMNVLGARGAYHKILTRHTRRARPDEAAPRHMLGEAAPEHFLVRENGVQFEVSFREGYSVGLFLDQRDNRRRLLTAHIAAGFPLFLKVGEASPLPADSPAEPQTSDRRDACPALLNTFAYTCGFSVCAAKAGARTTSIDLSRKNLEWGKRNFTLNGLEANEQQFLYGDVFDWLRRLAKQQRRFDAILLDPPTFSQSKASGVFRAEKDYAALVKAGLPLLKTGGVLFASTNAAAWPPEQLLAVVEKAISSGGRKMVQLDYAPQPPDFPVSRAEPAYLKTVWLRVT